MRFSLFMPQDKKSAAVISTDNLKERAENLLVLSMRLHMSELKITKMTDAQIEEGLKKIAQLVCGNPQLWSSYKISPTINFRDDPEESYKEILEYVRKNDKTVAENSKKFDVEQLKPRSAVLEVFRKDEPSIEAKKVIEEIEDLFCNTFMYENKQTYIKYVPSGAVTYQYIQKELEGDPNQNGLNTDAYPDSLVYMYSQSAIKSWEHLQLCKRITVKNEVFLEITREGVDFIKEKYPSHSKIYLALRDVAKHIDKVVIAAVGLASGIIALYEYIKTL